MPTDTLYTAQNVNDAWYAQATDNQARGERISPRDMINSLEDGVDGHATYARGKSILAEASIVGTQVSSAPPSVHLEKDIGPVDSPKLLREAGYAGTIPLYQAIALRKRT